MSNGALENPSNRSSEVVLLAVRASEKLHGSPNQIRIALVDSCTLFREGLAHVLERSGHAIIANNCTIAGAIGPVASGEPPHIMLCGVADGANTLDVMLELQETRTKFPGMYTVVLADRPSEKLLSQAAQCEIDAVLSKDISGEVLRCSLDLVILGQRLFPAPPLRGAPRLSDESASRVSTESQNALAPEMSVPDGIPMLSEREDQILRFLASGTRNKLIAHDLGISEATVKFHIRALLRKLGAANRTQAAIWGMQTRSRGSRVADEDLPGEPASAE